MKKIMFNDQYGLTQAVLEGRKIMTRRVVNQKLIDFYNHKETKIYTGGLPHFIYENSFYKIGDIVAIAQRYKDVVDYLPDNPIALDTTQGFDDFLYKDYKKEAGWNNKMFVKAELMPHQIRITDINVERLQDISNKDCIKEGIFPDGEVCTSYGNLTFYNFKGNLKNSFTSPSQAFASLIDKVSGKGTWERNPWVFAYSFELIK